MEILWNSEVDLSANDICILAGNVSIYTDSAGFTKTFENELC